MSPATTTTGRLPITILVQGGIASGKSTVARLIAARGGDYIDCDRLAHEVLDSPEVSAEVRDAFGEQVYDAERGAIDRKRLAGIVFEDPAALLRLEALVHPATVARVRERLEAARTPAGTPRAVAVIDAAVADKMKIADTDLRVFVTTTAETRRRRAVEVRGWEPGELERREARQGPLDDKLSRADFVVPNDGDLAEAESHVERFWAEHVDPRR